MKLTFKEIIKNLNIIEKKFNISNDPTERYALIQALNHIAEKELPVHGHWEEVYYKAMMKDKGACL